MPRTYRGRDIFWWMDAAGVLDERYDEVDDLVRARHVPSPQLIGTPERRSIDLNTLQRRRRADRRPAGAHRATESPSSPAALANVCRAGRPQAEPAARRLDDWAADDRPTPRSDRPNDSTPTREPPTPTLELDLAARARSARSSGRRATGPTTRWLDLPVFDHRGQIRHDGGVVATPRRVPARANILRRRRSSYIRGADGDTAELAEHLHRHLDKTRQHKAGIDGRCRCHSPRREATTRTTKETS